MQCEPFRIVLRVVVWLRLELPSRRARLCVREQYVLDHLATFRGEQEHSPC